MSGYDFSIVHRPGASMGKPDAMSRCHAFSGGSKASQSLPTSLLKPGQLVLSAIRSNPLPIGSLAPYETNLVPHLQALQEQDPVLMPLIQFLQDINLPQSEDIQDQITGFSMIDEVIHFNSLIYIPDDNAIKLEILKQNHDSPSAGHFGQAKTFALVTQSFYWPGLRTFVNDYVKSCDTCARNKMPHHKPFFFH